MASYETVPSSCLMTGKWQWSITDGLKDTGQQQVYRRKSRYIPSDAEADAGNTEYKLAVVENKTKVRGQGKSLQLRFESDGDNDFKLLGWAIVIGGVTTP